MTQHVYTMHSVYCPQCGRILVRHRDIIAADATIARHERRFPGHQPFIDEEEVVT